MRKILELHEIAYVDPLESMQRAYASVGPSMFIPWDGHNSAIANRVIAKELADRIEDPASRWLRGPLVDGVSRTATPATETKR